MRNRNKRIAQELLKQVRQQNSSTTQRIKVNIVPPKVIIQKNGRDKVVRIKPPKYVALEDLPCESTHPFVEIYSNETASWLQSFSESIMGAEKDTRYPLTNPEYDFRNPEISGFRIYLNGIGFTHIQISRVPNSNSLFQLDYYEITEKHYSKISKKYSDTSHNFKVTKRWSGKKNPIIPKLLMIVIVDISEKDFNSINLAYASSDLELMDETLTKDESDLEYARRAALFFRYIQVYMRNYDFETGNVKCCKITPLTFFGKEIEFKKCS